ncbi:Uncharacterised protein [Porphyromonas cangingivalis]|uniref:hypothetical protein n=1 Tax=Porphyromonas cangingivalis TaxID=36874 RepID=UPI000D907449|nr:hypothetical protein [Porphyromonas cangingivalis]SPY34831.1 Uncharacterised protein [Porphyromonas cangingivalis]
MKYKLLFILILGFILSPLKAQTIVGASDKAKHRIEKFRAERMTYIKSQVALTDAEVQKLNEILEAIDTKKFKIWSQMIDIHKAVTQEKKVTDDEYIQKLRLLVDLERSQALLQEELGLEIQKVFSPEKSYHTYVAIKHFYTKLKRHDRKATVCKCTKKCTCK